MMVLLVTAGCAHSAADHEQLGDRAYAGGAYRDALAEYRLALKAHASADLHAKTGAAAVHTQDFTLAAAEYRALAERDRSRTTEAAEDLERVARAALAANDRLALAGVLRALLAITPTRPLGKYAKLAALDAVDRGDTAGAMSLLPSAVAAAPDGRSADSLLFLLGMTAARTKDCGTAVPMFEGVIRRQREPGVSDAAREGLSWCTLLEGQARLAQGKPADAESWFKRAAAPGAPADVARAAYLGLGDVRLAQGDMPGALESYRQAIAGANATDSISAQAQQKINSLGKADGTATGSPNQL